MEENTCNLYFRICFESSFFFIRVNTKLLGTDPFPAIAGTTGAAGQGAGYQIGPDTKDN
jgi:hypothetical protein